MENNKEVLQGSTCNLDILFNLSDDIQCVINTCGYFEKVNRRLIKESGFSEPELLNKPFLSIIHPADIDNIQHILARLIEGCTAPFEARCLKGNAKSKPLIWKVMSFEGRFYLTANPINSQVSVDPNIRQSLTKPVIIDSSLEVTNHGSPNGLAGHNEHRFQALIQNGSDLLAILSPEGVYEYVSPTVKRILGFDPEYYLNKNTFSFIHPDDIPRVKPFFEKVVNNYKVELPAYRFISSDGKWHWLETVATNLLHDPAIKGIVVNSRDITLHREMENDILRNSRRFNNLIEHNNDGSFTLSRDWRFTSFNSVVRNTMGLPDGMVIGANIWKALPNGLVTNFYTEFSRAFDENIAVHFIEFSPFFNKWLEVNAYPFEDSLTVLIRDITDLKIQQLTLKLEKEVLEINAASTYTLKQLTDHLLSGFEEIHYGLKASLLIVDKDSNKLFPLSIPSLPEIFELSKAGVDINKEIGFCPLAAYKRETVYNQNVFSDGIPNAFTDVLKKHRISSSLSTPVINKNEDVLAVLSIFNSGHNQALLEDNSLIQRLSTIVQLLLENYQTKNDIEFSNERYKLTIQATSDSIWDLDLKKNILYRGNGFGKYHNQNAGYESIEQRKWELNIHPEDLKRVETSLEKALNEKTVTKWTVEYRYLKKDGSYALVIDKGFIIRNSDNEAIRIVGALQDVTAIKKNQDMLVQSEENYKNLFSNNPYPMWTYDLETKLFTMVNDAALTLYGYSREEFMKLDLFSIKVEKEHERLQAVLQKQDFKGDQILRSEWVHAKKDKTPITVSVISHLVHINGQRSRLVTVRDITERKKDRLEILEQNKRLREIAQISSHETRKPLASILGLVSLFDKTNLNNPLNKEIVHYLEVTANELDTVIHKIVKKTWQESEASTAFRAD